MGRSKKKRGKEPAAPRAERPDPVKAPATAKQKKSRRWTLLGLLCAVLGAGGGWALWRSTRPPALELHGRHPSIALITLDTTRADRLGCYGGKLIETPNLDQLASEGVTFDTAISAVPLTLPSHSTMMTGLFPYQHGVRQNGFYILPEKF